MVITTVRLLCTLTESDLEVFERERMYIDGFLLYSICRVNKFRFTTELAVQFYFHLIGNKMH